MQLNRAGLADKSAWEAKGYALQRNLLYYVNFTMSILI